MFSIKQIIPNLSSWAAYTACFPDGWQYSITNNFSLNITRDLYSMKLQGHPRPIRQLTFHSINIEALLEVGKCNCSLFATLCC